MRSSLLLVAVAFLLPLGYGCSSSDTARAPVEEVSNEDLAITPALLKSLSIIPTTLARDSRTGFIVGGKNATATIIGLKEINGRKIEDLEKDMRPPPAKLDDLPQAERREFHFGVRSTHGFLGPTESLLERLAEDNRHVVEKLGLTHQALARPLMVMPALVRIKNSPGEVTYRGRRFQVKVLGFKGFQLSPFRDRTRTSMDVTVKNTWNGKSISYSLLVPQMIERYGFYEGKGLRYRVEPAKVLEVFDFLKPAVGQ
jgi:hypothetical protein